MKKKIIVSAVLLATVTAVAFASFTSNKKKDCAKSCAEKKAAKSKSCGQTCPYSEI